MVKPDKNAVQWMGMQIWPAWCGFCPSERAYKTFLREYKINDPEPYSTMDGRVIAYDCKATHSLILLMFIGDHIDKKKDKLALAALLAHESLHMWQYIQRDMGVKYRDDETEAYALQRIMLFMGEAYNKTRVHRL